MYIGQSSPLTYTQANVSNMYVAMIKMAGGLLSETDIIRLRQEYEILLGMDADIIKNTSPDILNRLTTLRNQFELRRKSLVTHMWKLSGSPTGEAEKDWIQIMREKTTAGKSVLPWVLAAAGIGAAALMFT